MSNRDFSIDIAGMHYGLDSDEIDELERHYASKGEPLVTPEDYHRAFERRAFSVPLSAAMSATPAPDTPAAPEPSAPALSLHDLIIITDEADISALEKEPICKGYDRYERELAETRAAVARSREYIRYMMEKAARDVT